MPWRARWLVCAMLWVSGGAGAQEATADRPYTLPRTAVFDLEAGAGRPYRVMVWTPKAEPPPGGFKAYYVLDGNQSFPLIAALLAARSFNPAITGVEPAVVVGIGYPIDTPYDPVRRTLDLTPPAAEVRLPPRPDGKPWPPTGGADAFLTFIREQVQPRVRARYPVDPTREVLVGHSFGGLFTLYALFTQPDAFDGYVAGSPSLWFNDHQGFEMARRYAAQRPAAGTSRPVYISVGSEEQRLSAPAETDAERARAKKLAERRMVDNAREAAKRLEARPDLRVTFEVFAGEDHGSVVARVLARAIEMSFARP